MQFEQIQQKISYTFHDIAWLQQALTHRSYARQNYERLEFVGDSILNYVVALSLYQKYPQLSEGELSKIRSALVNQDSLADIALKIGLSDCLLLGDGEIKTGGRIRPSILADSLEAVFAAISLDSDFESARVVVEALYKDKLFNAERLLLKDSKSILQEYLQEKRIKVPEYTVIELSGPDHDSVFRIQCEIPELEIKVVASGKTKKEGSQLAAEEILNLIKEKNAKV